MRNVRQLFCLPLINLPAFLGMLRQMRCLEELIGFAAVMVMLPLVKNINDTIGRKNFPLQH